MYMYMVLFTLPVFGSAVAALTYMSNIYHEGQQGHVTDLKTLVQ